ncbi:MAG: hypothetical protein KBA46_05855 [Candidatus Omnitrophica bacterium]|nr:hypothetical protein [Candidatus Omnitrophota bacterium]
MNRKRFIDVFIILIMFFLTGALVIDQSAATALTLAKKQRSNAIARGQVAPRQSFFEIHMEPTTATERMFSQLRKLVSYADQYGIKTTLLFTPQWVEMILKDSSKMNQIKAWRGEGHEIGGHHHALSEIDRTMCVWDGYTNLEINKSDLLKIKEKCTEEKPVLLQYWNRLLEDSKYPQTMNQYMSVLSKLGDIKTVTMSGGAIDWPDGPVCEGGGRRLETAISLPRTIMLNNHPVTKLGGVALLPRGDSLRRSASLAQLKQEYLSTKEGIFGVVIHPDDFVQDPDLYKQWFEFLREQQTISMTLGELCG